MVRFPSSRGGRDSHSTALPVGYSRPMSSVEPGLAVRAVQAVAAGLSALGHDAAAILRKVGVDLSELVDPEARIPHAAAMQFWDTAVEHTGDDTLALHVADAAPIESFDVHAYAVLSSATVRDAFERACRYQRLIHDTTRLTLETEDGHVTLRHALPGGIPVPRQSAEFLLMAQVRLGRLASGGGWSPREVRFAHRRPANTDEHERLLGAPLRFDAGENALVSAVRDIEIPNPKADPGLLTVLDRYADGILRDLSQIHTCAERVRAHLPRVLCNGAPTAASVARALGMSPRTLNRRLSEEQTTFAEILDHYRRERAATLLDGDRASIAEVAFLLGFSELSAFYRAFKRWTGSTPGQYRKRAGGPGQNI